ncbi:MAG TPA: 2-oxoacid:acceptor oxidoreductase family protein, partial [Allocoleopsis sp.]
YHGDPDAERVIVIMGSGAESAHETVDYLNQKGEKVGVLKVRLYRPFAVEKFIESLPKSVKSIAVLDRCKEPGGAGEPLYLDVITAIHESEIKLENLKSVVSGRYGLSSKEFTPSMIKAVFDNLNQPKPKNHFTVGINDDLTHSSLDYDPNFSLESDQVIRAIFYGLGSDGTVGANKNSIKIIGEETNNYAQGYFVYDSKKSGSVTVSHLRFGPELIRSIYLISKANFVACHQPIFLERFDMLDQIIDGGTFLLNTPETAENVFSLLPLSYQEKLVKKRVKFYVINAHKVAKETGMGAHINTAMQVCFFAVSGVLPKDEAIEQIKQSIRKTYGKKGVDVVNMNLRAVDQTLANLYEVKVPESIDIENAPPV